MGWLAGFAIAAVLLWSWIRHLRKRNGPDETLDRAAAPHMDGDGSFDFDIVGEASYQEALDTIAGGKTKKGHEIEVLATLVREPSNPHDGNAIAVIIEGRKVGYVARAEAKAISKMIDSCGYSQFTADAMIVGGWVDRKGEGHYGVKLDLPS
ncbi:HIRAN domain-containing protein [Devosia sp. YR412]|uniref:HIRAN domain-containing protein n=1 Tax=Devosia sp. YR412 TaxID=1881030 RepID=UPI0008BB76F7|nr:HIRAN domain-containing protein [Devosia sp. YR412]SEP71428.1 HIRAN domain-containing protein [Devosia sp. YR412]